jgi:hypothetical protein
MSVVRGSGVVTTQSRSVSGFNALVLSGLGDITIVQGQSESLTIEAEDNIIPQINIEVSGGTLRIGFSRDKWQDVIIPTKPVKFNLTVKDLSSIESSGAGQIQADALKTSKLTVRLTGAGAIKLAKIEATSVTANLSGAGNIELAGSVTQQTTTLSGLGSYRAGDLGSDSAKITLSGAGSATIWARASLDVTISGAGSVNYYGSPSVSKTITGIGAVKGLGDK